MTQWKSDPPDPDWVDAVLEWRWTWPIARSMLTLLFIVAAIVEIADFRAAALRRRISECIRLCSGPCGPSLSRLLDQSSLYLAGEYGSEQAFSPYLPQPQM
jgi:hypothetical protein